MVPLGMMLSFIGRRKIANSELLTTGLSVYILHRRPLGLFVFRAATVLQHRVGFDAAAALCLAFRMNFRETIFGCHLDGTVVWLAPSRLDLVCRIDQN
jgi:hypothetical protein